jgi:hypothetical protein
MRIAELCAPVFLGSLKQKKDAARPISPSLELLLISVEKILEKIPVWEKFAKELQLLLYNSLIMATAGCIVKSKCFLG